MNKLSRMTIEVPITSHKKMKVAASMMGISLKDLITMSVEAYLENNMKDLSDVFSKCENIDLAK